MRADDGLDEDNPTPAEQLRAERQARASGDLYWQDKIANLRTAVEQEIVTWLRNGAVKWLRNHPGTTWPNDLATAISSGAYRKDAKHE